MTVRWGIIGCGDVTEVKSGPALAKASGSALIAVMRRNAHLAADYARRHGVPRWYDDAEKLIHDPEVDAVYVATPPGSHLEYALQIAEAGKPAYIEKPMARNYPECRRMLQAFGKAGKPLFVAYYRRALPRFLKVKQIIDSGRLGQPTGVCCHLAEPRHLRAISSEMEWRLVPEHSGGGIFLDLASHTLDLIDFLLGPLRDVSGCAANLACPCDVEDTVAMHFRTQCGAMGTGSWNFASAVREDIVQITGTNGSLSFATFADCPIRLTTPDGTETFDIPNPSHIQQPLIQTIVDQLNGGGLCPSTGEAAARTSRVMDMVLKDYYGGRDDAFWTRAETWPGRRPRV